MAVSPYGRFGSTTITGTNQSARRHTVIGDEEIPAITAYEFNTGYDSELWRQVAEYNSIDDLDAVAANDVLAIPQPQPSST